MSNELRGEAPRVHYLGATNDNEICEVIAWNGDLGFIMTNQARMDVTSVLNTTFGLDEFQGSAKLLANERQIDNDNEILRVDASSEIDKASVEFVVKRKVMMDSHGGLRIRQNAIF